MPDFFAKEKQTDLTPAKLNAMLRLLGVETDGPNLTVQDGGEEFTPLRRNTKYIKLSDDTDGGVRK